MKALQALRDDGSPEALYGLMRRFGMMYDKTIEDEQEKEWVFDDAGRQGRRRARAAQEATCWRRTRSRGRCGCSTRSSPPRKSSIDVIAEVLERHEPGYERDPTKKIQLLNHLASLKHAARRRRSSLPYLADMDEGVRYAAVETLLRQGGRSRRARAAARPLRLHSEDSLRIRILIADGFAELRLAAGRSPRRRRKDAARQLPDRLAKRAPPRRASRRNPARRSNRRRAQDATTSRRSCSSARARS